MSIDEESGNECDAASQREVAEPPNLAEICEACTDLAAQIAAHFEDLRKR